MEKFPRERNNNSNKRSKLEQAARAALAGAAFLGSVGAAELKAEAAPLQPKIEAHESFSVEKETSSFLTRIAAFEDSYIHDARGLRMLRTRIEIEFDIFALALQQRQPHFSAQGSSTLSGPMTWQTRENAKQQILPSLSALNSKNSALLVLQSFLTTSPLSPELKKKMGDW